MHMLDRPHLGILDRCGLGHGGQRLARRIRNQMQMKVSWDLVGHVWKRSEFSRRAKRAADLSPLTQRRHQQGHPQEGRQRSWAATAVDGIGPPKADGLLATPHAMAIHTLSAIRQS